MYPCIYSLSTCNCHHFLKLSKRKEIKQYSILYILKELPCARKSEVNVRTKSMFTLKKKRGEKVQTNIYFMCYF